MDIGKLVVVFLSIALSLATEFFFPIDRTDPIAVKQKHFWAVMFLVFSLVIGLPFESSYETGRTVDQAKELLRRHDEQSVRLGRFEDLDTLYDKNFTSTDPLLKKWADEHLNYVRERWSLGIMPIPREKAATQIAEVYPEAKGSIIATNVGSTKFYFDDGTYATSNLNARANGVPVVRFYLYSKYKRIDMHGGRQPKNIDDFFSEVQELHKRLGSLYSAVIDVDNHPLSEHRDLLIMDNKFLAETVLTPEWDPIRAEATENDAQLSKARQYFRDVLGALDSRYVVTPMSDEDVTRWYSHNPVLPRLSGNKRAEGIFAYLMNEIAGPL